MSICAQDEKAEAIPHVNQKTTTDQSLFSTLALIMIYTELSQRKGLGSMTDNEGYLTRPEVTRGSGQKLLKLLKVQTCCAINLPAQEFNTWKYLRPHKHFNSTFHKNLTPQKDFLKLNTSATNTSTTHDISSKALGRFLQVKKTMYNR